VREARRMAAEETIWAITVKYAAATEEPYS
jgi:hypothetical protein